MPTKRQCASVANSRVIRKGWRRKISWERDAKREYNSAMFAPTPNGLPEDDEHLAIGHGEENDCWYDDNIALHPAHKNNKNNNHIQTSLFVPLPPRMVQQRAPLARIQPPTSAAYKRPFE